MPLHERDTVREQIDECVFVGHDLTREVPKYRFPSAESPAREAYQVVADELMLDGNARQNLATFCQTWAEPELMALMAMLNGASVSAPARRPSSRNFSKGIPARWQ